MSASRNSKLLEQRKQAPHTSMFLRMLLRAAVLRRGRAVSALLAMIVAAAVATAMLNLYVDVQAKLRKEFRNYGANVVVIAHEGESLPPNALSTVGKILAGRGTAVPFAYAVARTSDGQSVVVSATDFGEVEKLNRWWSVTAWPTAANQALVGRRAAEVLGGKDFDLSLKGKQIHLTTAGTLQTGSAEDSRVYISLQDFETWTGVQPSTIEIAASGSPEDISAAIKQLQEQLPGTQVRPVRQIMEGEARVLGKTRATLFAAAILIILTTALCVLSTLIGWVFDRRKDFAIMKALGASQKLIGGFFAAEAAALGAIGSLFGFAIGVGLAAAIGRLNFNAPVIPRFSILPPILAGSVAVALLASVLPISLLRRVEPAMILRGE